MASAPHRLRHQQRGGGERQLAAGIDGGDGAEAQRAHQQPLGHVARAIEQVRDGVAEQIVRHVRRVERVADRPAAGIDDGHRADAEADVHDEGLERHLGRCLLCDQVLAEGETGEHAGTHHHDRRGEHGAVLVGRDEARQDQRPDQLEHAGADAQQHVPRDAARRLAWRPTSAEARADPVRDDGNQLGLCAELGEGVIRIRAVDAIERGRAARGTARTAARRGCTSRRGCRCRRPGSARPCRPAHRAGGDSRQSAGTRGRRSGHGLARRQGRGAERRRRPPTAAARRPSSSTAWHGRVATSPADSHRRTDRPGRCRRHGRRPGRWRAHCRRRRICRR